MKQLGKHGGLSTEYLSSGARHNENVKRKLISRKYSATARWASTTVDAKQADLPHEMSEGTAKQRVCRKQRHICTSQIYTQLHTHTGWGVNKV